MYGTIQAAKLWYLNLSKTLEDMGFEVNPYYGCVMNKMVDGKQYTVVWHIDDLKVSHVDPKVITMVLDQLSTKYGELMVTHGKNHVYVGMNITYNDDKSVKIAMKEYIQEAIDEFGEEITSTANSPASLHLFEVNDDQEKLSRKHPTHFIE